MIQKVKIRDIATFVRGVSYKKDQAQKEYSEGYTAILRANNISAGSILMDDLVYVPNTLISDDQIVNKGDIVITMSSGSKAHVGKVAIATETMNCAFGAFCGKLVCIGVLPSYLFYLLMSKRFRSHIESQCKGTNINNIKQGYILDYEIVLPARTEQERIVTRIEELFSELDNGVETLRKTKQQLAVYRQAVLKEAFDRAGEKKLPLKQIIEKPRYGTSKKCSYDTDEYSIPVYRIPNINYQQGTISHDDLKYATFTKDEFDSLELREGDILIIRSNGSVSLVGRSAVITEKDTHGLFAGYLMRLRIKDGVEILSQYLNLYLNTHYARYQIEQMAKSTSGVNNINSDEICRINLPVCDIDMQRAIIQEVEARLSVCDSIQKTIDTALQQAEAMRQSILKQAFEGKI